MSKSRTFQNSIILMPFFPPKELQFKMYSINARGWDPTFFPLYHSYTMPFLYALLISRNSEHFSLTSSANSKSPSNFLFRLASTKIAERLKNTIIHKNRIWNRLIVLYTGYYNTILAHKYIIYKITLRLLHRLSFFILTFRFAEDYRITTAVFCLFHPTAWMK